MKGNRLVLLILFLLVLGTGLNVYAQHPEWQDIGSGNTHFSAVWVNPDDRLMILAGSGNTILKTEDGGKSWKRVLDG